MVSSVVGPMARAGNPGDEDVVGVIDEVVTSEGIDEAALPAHVGGCDRHELAVARRGRQGSGPGEKVVLLARREQRRGDQDHRLVAGTRPVDDGCDRCSVTDRELMKQVLWRRWRHGGSVQRGADTSLTPRDRS
jgi:hypothetical protein